GGGRLRSLNIEHISSGDLFREKIRQKSPLGKRVENAINTGEFVPDEMTLTIVRKWFFSRKPNMGFILDGFPRNLLQAVCFDEWLEARGEVLTACILLDIPEDVAVERISKRRICPVDGSLYHLRSKPPQREGQCDLCGASLEQRVDDTEETVRKRYELYNDVSAPVATHYRSQGLLLTIDANRILDDVLRTVMRDLTRVLPVIQ
ncbi:MAG: nucleoside monophosphate kinase, partial [Opitutales bacterium]